MLEQKSASRPISYSSLIWPSFVAIMAVGLEPMAEFIDTAYLGHKNSLWVAAMAATNTFMASFSWIFNFLSYSITSNLAQAYGSRKKKQISAYIMTGLLLSIVLGLIISFTLGPLRHFVFTHFFNFENKLYDLATSYWNIRVFAFPLTLVNMTLIGILRGLQKIKMTLWLVLISTVFNAIMTYVLLWPMGMDLSGAAYATVGGFFLSVLAGLFFLFKISNELNLKYSLKDFKLVRSQMTNHAINLFGRTGVLTISFFLLTYYAAQLDQHYLASHQIALQLWVLASFVIDGLAITATSWGGKFLGEKNYTNFFLMGNRLLFLGLILGAVFALLYWMGEYLIIHFFTKDLLLVVRLNEIWPLLALAQIMNALIYVLEGLIFAANDYSYLRRSMFYGLILIYLPIYIGTLYFSPSFLYMWMALAGLNGSRLFTYFWWLHKKKVEYLS